MKLPEHPHDPLAPLRELRSPIGTRAIRERVLEQVAVAPLWRQLRTVAAEALVVGVAAIAVLRLSVPSTGSRMGSAHLALSQNAEPRSIMASSEPAPLRESRVVSRAARTSLAAHASEGPVTIFGAIAPRLPNAIEPAAYTPLKASMQPLRSLCTWDNSSAAPKASWFAAVSGGAMFSELRILAERGEVGLEDGWKTMALSYTNANGAADIHGVLLHHPGLTTPFLSKEGAQQYSLLLGANLHVGEFEFRALAGPTYLYASSQNYDPAIGGATAPTTRSGLGVSAEASVLYSLNSSVEAGVTSIASYGASVFNVRQTSGLFASFNYRFGQ